MLIVARLTAAWGALAVAARRWSRSRCRSFVAHPFFDTRWTNWIGLVTHKPVTEDYVPVLPWLGVMWWGVAAAAVAAGASAGVADAAAAARALRPLAVLGRWSLSFYMLHQPVLIGA